MINVEKIKQRVLFIDGKLSSMPVDSPLIQGWQTQRFARLSKSRDVYAMEKMRLLSILNEHRIEFINGYFVSF